MKKYYDTYDDLNQASCHVFRWNSNRPTPEIKNWLSHYQVMPGERIFEIGCSGDRDEIYLTKLGYQITSFDLTPEAICIQPKIYLGESSADHWDFDNSCLAKHQGQVQWVYSIAALQMLTEDSSRQEYLGILHNLLAPGGKLLLVTPGDGFSEQPYKAPKFLNKPWQEVACCCKVSWITHRRELNQAGFTIERAMVTVNKEHNQCMTVYLSKGV